MTIMDRRSGRVLPVRKNRAGIQSQDAAQENEGRTKTQKDAGFSDR